MLRNDGHRCRQLLRNWTGWGDSHGCGLARSAFHGEWRSDDLDKLTGLTWTQDANPAAGPKTWQQALDYIKTLNGANHLGQSDWRLPNVNELESLVNKQQNLAEWLRAQGFRNPQVDYYWTSTTYASLVTCAWSVGLYGGIVAGHDKEDAYFVWPVRKGKTGAVSLPQTGQVTCYDRSGIAIGCLGTGQDSESQTGVPWPSPRFVDNADGTVSDRLTGLAWSKEGLVPGPDACCRVNAGACKVRHDLSRASMSELPGQKRLAAAESQRTRQPGESRPGRQRGVVECPGIFPRPVRKLLVVQHLRLRCVEWMERQSARRRRDNLRQAARHLRLAGARRGVSRMRTRFVAFLFLLLASPLLASAGTIRIPRTGQNACYDPIGVIIDCAGTGQDGDKKAGAPWPAARFTDNGNGTATDNLTGLTWLKDANCTDAVGGIPRDGGLLNWPSALAWCNSLAHGTCGLTDNSAPGDWRLPNINELKSLVDHSRHDPDLPGGHPFRNVQSVWYWSSTSNPVYAAGAFTVGISRGSIHSTDKVPGRFGSSNVSGKDRSALGVWPVRGGELAAPRQPAATAPSAP